MKSKRLLIYILSFISSFLLVGAIATTTRADSKVHRGLPSTLQGKYWQAPITPTQNSLSHHEYFYATKDGFVLKHTKDGTLRAKWMLFKKLDDHSYTLNGADSQDDSMAIWIFIKPNHNWTKIRIGYICLPINKIPSNYPSYYAKTIATRVSKVTAILH